MIERLLLFCPASVGGIADYTHAQANALAGQGVEVSLLCNLNWPHSTNTGVRQLREIPLPVLQSNLPRWASRVRTAISILRSYGTLVRVIQRDGHRRVLLASYIEYLAPTWAGWLRELARNGVVFGAIVHDPVRDYVVGPGWWHKRSVAAGYSFLREAFVHAAINLDTVRPMGNMRTTVIPHGPFAFPAASKSREQVRCELGIPRDGRVLLAFGHLRDGKNLDLVLRSLVELPDVYLIVAGGEQSGAQKPASFYLRLAEDLGVGNRCHWLIRFIKPDEVGGLFAAADLVALTYSRAFRSASGVLNAAVYYRRPCLASGGEGNLQSMVKRYSLGFWIEPDNLSALLRGLRRWQLHALKPRWDDYEADNSWERNAELVKERMFSVKP